MRRSHPALRHPCRHLATPTTGVAGRLRAVVDWLRAGYPTAAPRTGHSALLALNGPLALTPAQRSRIINELNSAAELNGAFEVPTIEVAITKATDQLPTPSQTRDIAHLLHQHSARG